MSGQQTTFPDSIHRMCPHITRQTAQQLTFDVQQKAKTLAMTHLEAVAGQLGGGHGAVDRPLVGAAPPPAQPCSTFKKSQPVTFVSARPPAAQALRTRCQPPEENRATAALHRQGDVERSLGATQGSAARALLLLSLWRNVRHNAARALCQQ